MQTSCDISGTSPAPASAPRYRVFLLFFPCLLFYLHRGRDFGTGMHTVQKVVAVTSLLPVMEQGHEIDTHAPKQGGYAQKEDQVAIWHAVAHQVVVHDRCHQEAGQATQQYRRPESQLQCGTIG